MAQGYDAVFVGCGAPRGRDLDMPGRNEIKATSTSVSTGWPRCLLATSPASANAVIVLGGGNTAMDCCRSSRRLGGTDVKVIVRSGFDEMKASPWEKEDAQHEGIPIINFHVPKTFEHTMASCRHDLRSGAAVYDDKGRRSLVPTGAPDVLVECDAVLVAVGQENAFPWIEADSGITFDKLGPAGAGQGHLSVHCAQGVLWW
jgi:formate dehydrogenase beta subunit